MDYLFFYQIVFKARSILKCNPRKSSDSLFWLLVEGEGGITSVRGIVDTLEQATEPTNNPVGHCNELPTPPGVYPAFSNMCNFPVTPKGIKWSRVCLH